MVCEKGSRIILHFDILKINCTVNRRIGENRIKNDGHLLNFLLIYAAKYDFAFIFFLFQIRIPLNVKFPVKGKDVVISFEKKVSSQYESHV